MVTIAAVAALLALSGCTPGSQPRHPPGSPSGSASRTSGATPRGSVLLDCGDDIGAHPPDSRLQVILGVVALPTSAAGPALQTAPTGGQPSSPRLFAKTGLLIKAGTDFQLVVPARAADRFGIGWGSAATPSQAVVVHHCADDGQPSSWLAYAGGYWLDHPACVTVQIRTAERRQSVEIGLGTPCPGQRPPSQPSAT